MSDTEIEKLVHIFKTDRGRKAFLGYSSALESICCYLDKNEPNTRIKNVSAIIAMSEGISENSKKKIKRFFGKQPVSRYSNVENGILAQQSIDGSDEFEINWASYHIEILDVKNNEVLTYGKPGRIVITDLFNYAMPMIRYDTGDIGIMDYSKDGKRLVLKSVEGRKMDMVFDTNGDLVSSFTITNNMWLYPEIKQYQFIQVSHSEYLFKLNLSTEFKREKDLINEFKNYFGEDAIIAVEYVNEIPLLNSGKRKKVMNLML
jgi:phenylacetate-CoA ligase